jgi:hypothetical protein
VSVDITCLQKALLELAGSDEPVYEQPKTIPYFIWKMIQTYMLPTSDFSVDAFVRVPDRPDQDDRSPEHHL